MTGMIFSTNSTSAVSSGAKSPYTFFTVSSPNRPSISAAICFRYFTRILFACKTDSTSTLSESTSSCACSFFHAAASFSQFSEILSSLLMTCPNRSAVSASATLMLNTVMTSPSSFLIAIFLTPLSNTNSSINYHPFRNRAGLKGTHPIMLIFD